MNYELAKELKDAGFLQRKWRYAMHYIPEKNSNGEQMIVAYQDYEGSGNDLVYIPTTSELIEACGSIILWRCEERYGNHWHAKVAERDDMRECKIVDATTFAEISGDTPGESVARLWLKLHE